MTKRLSDTLTLFIRITDPKTSVVAGLCTWLDEPTRPKEFSIKIVGDTKEEMLKTLAHEMVHVKQYSRGELRDLISFGGGIVNFMGTRYRMIDSDLSEYMEQPWEIQAFSQEPILYNKYISQ